MDTACIPGEARSASRDGPLLDVRGLRVSACAGSGPATPIIHGLDLRLRRGEVLALVGESGSGKSMTARAITRLLPAGLRVEGGEIGFGGRDLLALSEAAMNHVRGGHIATLFQQPQTMLDPTSRVGPQVGEALRKHRRLDRGGARDAVARLLADVGIPAPASRAECYAHELSGGMAQRVMMAAALSGEPELLIADEPTTALDVTVQVQILRLLDEHRRRRHLAVLLITHDFAVVSALADRVAVMYAGRIVEEGPARDVLADPRHPYTRGLIRCSLLEPGPGGRLYAIPSAARHAGGGCCFAGRCTAAGESGLSACCAAHEPGLAAAGDGRSSRCWTAHEAAAIPLPPDLAPASAGLP